MNSGKLNRKIILQCRADAVVGKAIVDKDMIRDEFAVDENGFAIENWITVGHIWASVTNIHGKESLDNLDQISTNTYKRMKFRYKKCLDCTFNFNPTHDFRIIYNNSVWNITSIDDIKDKHEYMEVLVTRIETEWNE